MVKECTNAQTPQAKYFYHAFGLLPTISISGTKSQIIKKSL
jgi:hypothetical protein